MKKTIKDYDLHGKRVIIRCDFNVPIKDGKLAELGTHKELMEKKGLYEKLSKKRAFT